jgi:hypothetical protein
VLTSHALAAPPSYRPSSLPPRFFRLLPKSQAAAARASALETDSLRAELSRTRVERDAALAAAADATGRVERDRAELAFKLGRDAALASLAGTVSAGAPATPAPAPHAAALIPASPTSAPSAIAAIPVDAAPALGAGVGLGASAEEVEVDHHASVAATSSLLLKHEQLRQQELALLALRQQHAQQKIAHAAHLRHAAATSAMGAFHPHFSSYVQQQQQQQTGGAFPLATPGGFGNSGGSFHSMSSHSMGPHSLGGPLGDFGASAPSGAMFSPASGRSVGVDRLLLPPSQSTPLSALSAPVSAKSGMGASAAADTADTPGTEFLTFAPDGALVVSASSLLPPELRGNVVMRETAAPPPGGWNMYQHPPAGTEWPKSMAFFAPLVDPGIPILKHGRFGYPHKRLLWLDISEPSDPILVWGDSTTKQNGNEKDKNRIRLVEIVNIVAGAATPATRARAGDARWERSQPPPPVRPTPLQAKWAPS